jgi:hypothetical protein
MAIRLGSVTINKIRLGSVLINKAYLGSAQIYPTGGGGGGGGIGVGLFDGMETFSLGLPTTKSWTKVGGASFSLAQSASNVTEGSFSADIGSAFGGLNLVNAIFYDFSGITNILVDVKPSGVAQTAVQFAITDGTLTETTQTTLGSGTATTLTLTPILVNKASAKLRVQSVDALDNGQTFFIDNIRCT